MSTSWFIDARQVVHAGYCASIGEKPTPYYPSMRAVGSDGKTVLIAPVDYRQMAEHLARPDAQNGMITTVGSSMIKPCGLCIPKE